MNAISPIEQQILRGSRYNVGVTPRNTVETIDSWTFPSRLSAEGLSGQQKLQSPQRSRSGSTVTTIKNTPEYKTVTHSVALGATDDVAFAVYVRDGLRIRIVE